MVKPGARIHASDVRAVRPAEGRKPIDAWSEWTFCAGARRHDPGRLRRVHRGARTGHGPAARRGFPLRRQLPHEQPGPRRAQHARRRRAQREAPTRDRRRRAPDRAIQAHEDHGGNRHDVAGQTGSSVRGVLPRQAPADAQRNRTARLPHRVRPETERGRCRRLERHGPDQGRGERRLSQGHRAPWPAGAVRARTRPSARR